MTATLQDQLRELWRPRKTRDILEWVRSEIWLSERFTNRPGLYDPTYTAYLVPCHRWFGDPDVRRITTPKGAQLGFTTFLANALMWAISEDPGPALFLTSTTENAQSWSEREWLPRINDCALMKSLLTGKRGEVKKLEQSFLSMTVRLSGAQSENNLASRPIRYLLNDEVDKWPPGFLGIAEARTLSYRGVDKSVRGSTCTTEDGPIWLAWMNSTQHMWHVQCPVCREWQVLDFFKSVKWPSEHRDLLGKWDIEKVRRDTWCECIVNGCRYEVGQRDAMVRAGEAVATNDRADPSDKGIHLPSLLSPFISLADLAALWLQKKEQPGGRQDFYNQYLGLPFTHDEWKITDEKLLAMRREDYLLREVPVEPAILTFAADPGEKVSHWSVEAQCADGTAYLVDHGTVHTIEDLLPTFHRLEYPLKGTTRKLRPGVGLIDSGWATERVYRVCARSNGVLSPSKGSSAEWGKGVETSKLPAFPTVVLYTYIDFMAKCELYIDRIGRQSSPRLYWPANVGNDWVDGHSNQELRSKQTPRGTMKFFKPLPADHYGDCSKLHRITWWVLRLKYGQEVPVQT